MPFTSVVVIDPEPVDPGTIRETPGGTVHIRNLVETGTETVTIEGEEVVGDLTHTINVNLNPATGRGSLFGTWVLETDIDTWTGTVRARIEDGLASGTFVGHGEEGTMQRGTLTEVAPGVLEGEGVILHRPAS